MKRLFDPPGDPLLGGPFPAAAVWPAGDGVYTVSRLNRTVRSILESRVGHVLVTGEISNYSRPASGHIYFTLKDDRAQLRCAMFRSDNAGLSFTPEVGMEVLAGGRISLYEGRGNYQLIVETLKPAGAGELHLAFERLKRRLHEEGLFDAGRKRELPRYPGRLGVLTSPTGAALRDVLSVLRRRWPLLPIIVYPVPVQGDAAAPAICEMLERADRRGECDVLLLARGGGSLEDLWPFNEEQVARAVRASGTPVVTGIGHEIDTTIVELAADRRGATPSAAAELLSPNGDHERVLLQDADDRMVSSFRQAVQERRMAVERLAGRLETPTARIVNMRQRADDLSMRMVRAMCALEERGRLRLRGLVARLAGQYPGPRVDVVRKRWTALSERLGPAMDRTLEQARIRVRGAGRALEALDPNAVLQRGYAILEHPRTGVVTDVAALAPGDTLRASLHRGEAELSVRGLRRGDPDPDR